MGVIGWIFLVVLVGGAIFKLWLDWSTVAGARDAAVRRMTAVQQKETWKCSCGSVNSAELEYCLSCRKKRRDLEAEAKVKCPHCGANNAAGSETCWVCSKPIGGAEGKAADQAAQPKEEFKSKEDIYKMAFAKMAQKTPSDHFASGAVFDISRRVHDRFAQCVRSGDMAETAKFFRNSYALFCTNPGVVGFSSSMVNTQLDDTNILDWTMGLHRLPSGDSAAICYIPVKNDHLAARMIGIIVSQKGDGYYYSMINKDGDMPSDVKRNKGMFGVEKVGTVKGFGFDLEESFLECIKKDFYNSPECFF